MNLEFWKGKKVFITGHTGFKGSWLSLWLKNLEVELTGYSLDSSDQKSFFQDAKIANGMNSIVGDICDLDSLKQAIIQSKPDIIIHMAAQALVRDSYSDPISTYRTNIMGTINVFEAARECDTVKSIINVTSDKCYENKERELGYKEDEPMGGFDPYSSSKGCAELIASAYRNSFFKPEGKINMASVRAGNVIGGGDWSKDRLIPDAIKAFYNNKKVLIRNPGAIRPWQFVLEPLRGYLMLAEKLYNGEYEYAAGWNFGPKHSDVRNVEWIIKNMCKNWGKSADWIYEKEKSGALHEANYLKLDITKAENILNWHPVLDINDTLELIIDWYKSFEKNENISQTSVNQIIKYQELLK
jgi:CDP-glucose 4,6-dehydratase